MQHLWMSTLKTRWKKTLQRWTKSRPRSEKLESSSCSAIVRKIMALFTSHRYIMINRLLLNSLLLTRMQKVFYRSSRHHRESPPENQTHACWKGILGRRPSGISQECCPQSVWKNRGPKLFWTYSAPPPILPIRTKRWHSLCWLASHVGRALGVPLPQNRSQQVLPSDGYGRRLFCFDLYPSPVWKIEDKGRVGPLGLD